MNSSVKNLFMASVLIGGIGLPLPRLEAADTLTTLHAFTAVTDGVNSDGDYPEAGLILSGNVLYGTASSGGASQAGTVFAVNTDGSGFTVLHTFSSNTNYGGSNIDGAEPAAGLLLSGGTLYGTAEAGGRAGSGTVFALDINSTNFTTIYSFTNGSDGGSPVAGVILSGDTLYGTATFGGDSGWGTVFSVNTNGSNFTTLYTFTNGSDGSVPSAALVLSGGTLYSTTAEPGTSNNGTVFSVGINGSNFTTLHTFSQFITNSAQLYYNSDGAYPFAGLILSGDTLYGAASQGGTEGHGTVFSLSTSGSGFATLHSFAKYSLGFFNKDGVAPYGTLALSGSTLYGAAKLGGEYGLGTVFSVSTSGADFTTLYSLGKGTNGAWPEAGVVLSGDDLYGTTSFGGRANVGSVFGLSTSGSSSHAPPPNTAMLAVQYNGDGSASPNDNGKSLEVGKTFRLTAVPGHNWIFSNWVASGSADFVTNNPVLEFTMQSNLVLQANFIANPFLPVQGKYHGLFAPTNAPRMQGNSGSFLLTLTGTGACSGSLDLGGQSIPLTGKFDAGGAAGIVSRPTHGIPSLITILQLNFTNESVSGTVGDDVFTAGLTGYRDVFSSSEKATQFEGQHTLVIPGTTNPAVGPFGVSYATVKVDDLGNITLAGSLADGTAISQSSVVSQDGYWPFYVSLYDGKGSLWGWNQFTNSVITNSSALSWINGGNSARTAVYRSGFTNQDAILTGGPYQPSPPLLPDGLTVTLQDSNFTITVTDLSENTNKLTLKTNKTTGLISGSFAYPGSTKASIKVNGVILQGHTNAQGYFLETNQSGTFTVGTQ
jgi:uncharacterized repeat protein (TIGR03803 family)